MSRNKAASKDNKTNIEETVWNNLSNPQLTLDKQGITYTHLNLSVKSNNQREKIQNHYPASQWC